MAALKTLKLFLYQVRLLGPVLSVALGTGGGQREQDSPGHLTEPRELSLEL